MRSQHSDFAAILSPRTRSLARAVLEEAEGKNLSIATAESCTGGLLSTLLTDLPRVSHCFACGFVVYSDQAKSRLLGIAAELIDEQGAVSQQVAVEMAQRALRRSDADIALSITGFAGPAGSDDEEGLVYIAVAGKGTASQHLEFHFGAIGRDAVRLQALEAGLDLLSRFIRLV